MTPLQALVKMATHNYSGSDVTYTSTAFITAYGIICASAFYCHKVADIRARRAAARARVVRR